MPITFDLLSIFPYLFTLICFFGEGLITIIFILLVVFSRFALPVLFPMGASSSLTLPLPSLEVTEEKSTAKPKPAFSVNQFEEVFPIIGKTAADLFPANLQTCHCKDCHKVIVIGQGYKHYLIGTRGTFCLACHSAKGLPVRSDDGKIFAVDKLESNSAEFF